jgi:hypothetical protein
MLETEKGGAIQVEHIMNKMYAANVTDGLFSTEWTEQAHPFGSA